MWTPAAGCEKAEGHAPQLLHIPLVLFMLIRKEAHPLMLHEVLIIMMKHPKETGATNNQGKAWDLVAKWCIVAAQKDAQGGSLVSFTVEAITEGDDSYFKQWVEQHLNATMGVWPAQETRGGSNNDSSGRAHRYQLSLPLSLVKG